MDRQTERQTDRQTDNQVDDNHDRDDDVLILAHLSEIPPVVPKTGCTQLYDTLMAGNIVLASC